jgi:hypothetical protein
MERIRNINTKIVGNGDIAKAISEIEPTDKLYFCSGVSDSSEVRESEFQREIDLLLKQDRNEHIVYFSSLSTFCLDSAYFQHKRHMEDLVKENFPKHTIVRIGNIDWGTNPHTLINFLRNRYKQGEPLEIRDTYRYVVSKEEFLYWVNLLPNWSCEISIPGRRMKVAEVVKEYVL